jgi:tetratricopeptide (TPR) repeat protein
MRLGDVLGNPYSANLGDTAGALESFQKGAVLLEGEAARHPNAAGVREALMHAQMRVGNVLTRQGKADEAISVLTRATEEAEALYNRSHDFSAAQQLSQAYVYLAQAQQVAGEQKGSVAVLQEALSTSRKSLQVLEAVGQRGEESWQVSLASAQFRVAYALKALGNRSGDVSYHRQALDIQLQGHAVMRALAASNPNKPRRRELADGLLSIAMSRWKCCRDLSGAIQDARKSLESFQRLAEENPHNAEARRDVGNAYMTVGGFLGEAGRRLEARTMNRKALAVYEELERTDPASAENATYLAEVRARIASLE